jgi:hypothetical protein
MRALELLLAGPFTQLGLIKTRGTTVLGEQREHVTVATRQLPSIIGQLAELKMPARGAVEMHGA